MGGTGSTWSWRTCPARGWAIIRKKPDIRYKNPEELAQLPAGAARPSWKTPAGYVRPGGTLVYSTCTMLPEENEDVTGGFPGRAPGVCAGALRAARCRWGPRAGQVTLWPQRHGTDGFYICRMRRRGLSKLTDMQIHDAGGDDRRAARTWASPPSGASRCSPGCTGG